MKLNLYVVRHGQTFFNSTGLLQGQLDSNLTALGVQGGKDTGETLSDIQFCEVYSSDLGRAIDTMKLIGYVDGKEDPRLRERDYGSWSGKPWIEYKKASSCNTKILPGVESDEELNHRWKNFANDMIKNLESETDSTKNILIVTHGGMIRVITHHLMEFSTRPLGLNLKKCGVGNNSISLFELEIENSEIVNCEVIKIFDCKHLVCRRSK